MGRDGVIAVAGVCRETILIDRVGEYTGHVLLTATLVVAIIVVAALYFGNTSIAYTHAELVAVGAGWAVLTVGFEFLVGFLEETPPSETIAQCNVLAGQVWAVVPLTLLFAPLLVTWLSG